MWKRGGVIGVVGLSLLACGGGGEAGATRSRGAEHAHHAGGPHAGRGHHHDHASPAALRPLMRELFGEMGELRGALEEGEVADAAVHARAIAVACDDQDVHHVDPERFGPRFTEIDQRLHGAAAEMAAAAEAGELEAARAGYTQLYEACVACHAQAPTAGRVDISALAPRGDGEAR